MYPPSIQKLISQFSKFPTVGPRTAARFVFYLLKTPKEEIADIVKTISELRQNIKLCSFCFNPFEASANDDKLCQICQSLNRDKALLCIVEKETDLLSLEKTKKYKGLYFILGGTVNTLKNEDIKRLRLEELKKRITNQDKFDIQGIDLKEIIIATNSTTEGESTALYLERFLSSQNIKITRLGRGLPLGAELEYADEETIGCAIEGRK